MSILPWPSLHLGSSLGRAGTRFVTALLPHDCFLCGRRAGAALLCDDCDQELPRIVAANCPRCALPTPNGAVCGACLKRAPYFDASQCCFRYAFPVDRLVQSLKYQHHLVVADFFAEKLLAAISPLAFRPDLLLALPLSVRRLRERGFNQALEIARPLASRWRLPLPTEGYRRIIDTAPQAGLPWQQRQRNVHGAFECDMDLTGKTVAVVDDVMTSGASLNEFARILKMHGAAKVLNLVVARAFRQ